MSHVLESESTLQAQAETVRILERKRQDSAQITRLHLNGQTNQEQKKLQMVFEVGSDPEEKSRVTYEPSGHNKERTRARGKKSTREARTFGPFKFEASVPNIGPRRPKSITDIPHSTPFITAQSLPDLETAYNLIYQIYTR
ncbi:hypothetical protein PIB30_060573 [Stylosanthes scabra]|uniref:Uncharacterized protein n=1 Tax=Stylosanthes scabra TaxID=79078 RepID=A0ABU6WKN4_9FABA|nr:hypothetical protein [Stylosanthes scabra]